MANGIEYLKSCNSFEHFISLGHCCYVAIELERMGLRDSSMPFDWVRTRWWAIENSFSKNFEGYLNYDDLYQKKNDLHCYKNLQYGVGFFHDFVDCKSLKSQIANVQKKYERRIERFFSHIVEPTLFIRYMWDYEELVYVASHYAEIEQMIKRYNTNNEIVFITHDIPTNLDVSLIKLLFFIDKDEDCELNERPISSNEDLYFFLSTVEYNNRQKNIQFNKAKNAQKIEQSKKLTSRLKKMYKKLFVKKREKYIHYKQI